MVVGYLYEVYFLFVEMAPYLMIGLACVAILNLYVTKDFVRKQIGKDSLWSVVKASLLGVPLPLCSCGVIPITVYMAESKASKGAVTSFLISTPQTGIDSIVATYGMMGPIIGVFRPVVAFIMGILGGLFISLTDKPSRSEKKISLTVLQNRNVVLAQPQRKSYLARVKSSFRYAFTDFLDDITVEFLIGLAVAGAISYFLPTDLMAGTGLQSGIWGMLLMIAIGVPMYVCATESIPIAVSLMLKGFSPGVAFVFLVAGPATNVASLKILSRSLGKKLISLYLFILILLTIGFGLVLDYIFLQLGVDPVSQLVSSTGHSHTEMLPYLMKMVLATGFAVLMLFSLYRKYGDRLFKKREKDSRKFVKIIGMSCSHCATNVTNALSKVENISDVEVKLSESGAYYEGDVKMSQLKLAVERYGYRVDV